MRIRFKKKRFFTFTLCNDGLNDHSVFPVTDQPAGHSKVTAFHLDSTQVCRVVSMAVLGFVCMCGLCLCLPEDEVKLLPGSSCKTNRGSGELELLTSFLLSPISRT